MGARLLDNGRFAVRLGGTGFLWHGSDAVLEYPALSLHQRTEPAAQMRGNALLRDERMEFVAVMLGRDAFRLVETISSLVIVGRLFLDEIVTSVVMLGEQVFMLTETGGSAATLRRTALLWMKTVELVRIVEDKVISCGQRVSNLSRSWEIPSSF